MRSFLIRCLLIACACSALGGRPAIAAGTAAMPLRVDEIFAPEPLIGRTPASIAWAPDGSRFLYTLPGGTAGPLATHVYDTRSHSDRIFFRASANGKGARPTPEFVWSPDSRQLAYLDDGNLWAIDAAGTRRVRLAADADDPQWSPDGTHIAYVHAGDIYAVGAAGGMPVRYSRDGGTDTINGDPDWVYSEELDVHHAYSWSPDGNRIAYLRFDERTIAPFPIVDFLRAPNIVTLQRYPLAGQRNAIVSLRVGAPGGATRELYSTRRFDDYLPAVGWTPDGRPTAEILDRAQRHLRYVAFAGSRPSVLTSESDTRWVDVHPAPRWLHDGRRFLFISDRDGEPALYSGDVHAGAAQRLTHGYAVTSLAGVDERLQVAFVQAAYPTRRDSTVLAIPLRGGIPRPLARGHGSHAFALAPNGRAYVRADSAFGMPPVYTIGSTLGGTLLPFVRTALPRGRLFGPYRLSSIPSRFGPLDAWTIEPPGFDPAKR